VKENKLKIESNRHSSLSPRVKQRRKKPTTKFYKANKSNHALPPVNKGINFSIASGYSSEYYQARSSFPRIPIRDMSKAIEPSVRGRKSTKPPKPKVDPRKQMMKRLMLLDSVGKVNTNSTLGSIRKGYITQAKVRIISFEHFIDQ
jgi:hypothetical protein